MGRIFPNGLLLRDGAEHKHHRKIMHEAFTRPGAARLRRAHEPDDRARPSRDGRGRRRAILAFRRVQGLTLDIAASIFVGVDLGPETRRMNDAFEDMVAASMSRIRLRIPGLEFYRGLVGREFMLDAASRGMLEQEARATRGARHVQPPVPRAQPRTATASPTPTSLDHMIFLMMAAHDTTTSTLSLDDLRAREASRVAGARARGEPRARRRRSSSFDDLDKLEALGWAMKETLRRYPPLPVIPRVATARFEFGGYRDPGGSHGRRRRRSTPTTCPSGGRDPYRFDPERFAPARAEHERHTHSLDPVRRRAAPCASASASPRRR